MIFAQGKSKYGSLTTATSGGSLALAADSLQFQVFTGTMAHTMVLPDATTTSNGSGILFTVINESTGAITVNTFGGAFLYTVAAGTSVDFLLVAHGSAAGSWKVSAYSGAAGGGVGSVAPGAVVTSNYSVVTADDGRVINVDSSAGAVTVTLPSPVAGFVVTVKDYGGSSEVFPITVARFGSEEIDNAQSNFIISIKWHAATFYSDGTDWFIVGSFKDVLPGLGVLGLFAGSFTTGVVNTIDYIQFAALNNATDFGDLVTARSGAAGFGTSTTGIIAGGNNFSPNIVSSMEQILYASLGNASNFGTLTQNHGNTAGHSNSTRGVIGGGDLTTGTYYDFIDYIELAAGGNSADFGDLTLARRELASAGSSTRALWAGGDQGATEYNVIDYVTIASLGNATDFGDLTVSRGYVSGASSSVRAVFAGGGVAVAVNTIDYVTIASAGNATDFGDIATNRRNIGFTSDKIKGILAGGHDSVNETYLDSIFIATLGNSTNFGEITQTRRLLTGVSGAHGGL